MPTARLPTATTRRCARLPSWPPPSRRRRSAISRRPRRAAPFSTTTRAAWPCARSTAARRSGTAPSPIRSRSAVASAGHGIAARAGAARLSARRRRQPHFRRRAARPARPDRRPARARRARAGGRGDRASARSRRARRGRRRRVPRRSRQHASRNPVHPAVPELSDADVANGPLRVGVGGPVGSGKTALMDALCKRLRERYEIAAITNDIYTKWDAEYLVRSGALAPERIAGVETGGCPHTAIREDASINLAAVAEMRKKFPDARPGADRIRRRQPGGDLLARARRPHDLRDRRRRRRQDPVARAAPASPAPTCW